MDGSQRGTIRKVLLTDSTVDNMSMPGDFSRIDERIHASKSCPREALHAEESIGGTREQGHSGRNTVG